MEVDRTWDAVKGTLRRSWVEDARLTAEAGCGIPEKFCILPNGSRGRRTLKSPEGCAMLENHGRVINSELVGAGERSGVSSWREIAGAQRG